MSLTRPDLVFACDPLGRPNPAVVVAAARAGALGVLDAGDATTLAADLALVADRCEATVAVRLTDATPLDLDLGALDPTGRVATAVVDRAGGAEDLARLVGATHDRQVLVVVRSLDEARAAIGAGASGLVASGCEAGGRVGDTEAFILLQQIADLGVHVWVRGGIGRHTAPAAIAAGARGVVLDVQLALAREANLPRSTRAAIAAMDGSETRVVGGYRIFTRPDLPAAHLTDHTAPHAVADRLGADVTDDLVPIGQDGALARPLGDRYRTVGGIVLALGEAVTDHVAAARRQRPLAPGAGIAASHGTTHPVAQGPMTRVSDRAAFARAVADGGGLPFLALALMTGAEVRELLTETAELLGERPWGVGILGFVPPEVRDQQLEVVHDVRPPVALIAGGRPSQAAPLEAAGIATYLHVPSPGLLERFLADGARRFVFEGRECGGHVGPRTSFPLWDAQMDRLLDIDDAAGLHVLFAGGIHDARSAAAVAALAGPLAERGAHVGVLMGTAYLFTAEAVDTGAILPGYQDEAVACSRTVLLETSPGHATRCVETPYVRAFEARKAELAAAGVPAKQAWAELESMNLGRLRIASKGLIRASEATSTTGQTGGEGAPTGTASRGARAEAADNTTPELATTDAQAGGEGAPTGTASRGARAEAAMNTATPAQQREEGMVMIGQIATLRSERTTIAALHDEVTAGATARVEVVAAEVAGAAPRVEVREPAPLDVAIVGMAGLFPGAVDIDELWANIVRGHNAITEVPAERWESGRYYDPEAVTVDAGRKTPSKWGGFLPTVGFDPLRFGIPPASLGSIEPVQLLSLEVAARALADAGYDTRPFDRTRASVVFGAENGNDLSGAYGFRALYPQLVGALPPELDAVLPSLDEDSFPGVLTNVIAGRIANRLDLGGTNYTVDAACAASLAALDAACKELVTGSSDLVLCGGADLHNGINDYLLFASVHALSPTGQCRTFDRDADGIALGEGIACVVLKRLADAERDGDRVYAVIDAVAGSSDGRHLGLTAPRKEGQQLALRRAYAQAGISPAGVGLVEAHGTGTVVGDRTELATLTEVFAEHGAAPGAAVLGSVKSQIGHTKCAAGLAGLVKAARALHHAVLPPTNNVSAPNDAYDPGASPFRFVTEARPWPASERHAGVSAFGFGGSNFHAVLSSYQRGDTPAHGVETWPAELFLVRATDATAARARLEELSALVASILETDPTGQRHRLRDLAATVSLAGSGPVQVAIVATDLTDLADKVVVATTGTHRNDGVFVAAPAASESTVAAPAASESTVAAPAATDPSSNDSAVRPGDPSAPVVAFLHPGQGSQRPGMLADLFVAFPHLHDLLRRGERWVDVLFPPAAFTPAERAAQRDAITDTTVAQPTLGIAGLALTRLLADLGVRPDLVAGHSYGELVALATAGALDTDDLLTLSAARGEAIVAAAGAGEDPGAMAAASATLDELLPIVADIDGVVVANRNGPRQQVLSGPTPAVDAAIEALSAAGVAAKRLPVACAFHSPVVAGASASLTEVLAGLTIRAPQLPVFSNTTGARYPADPDGVRRLVADQVAAPVGFVEEVEAMYAAGARVFVEAGPGRVLTQLVRTILGDRPHLAVACDVDGEPGVRRFLLAVAELAAAGVPVDVAPLFADRARTLVLRDLPVPAPGWTVDGHLVRRADGTVVPGGLQPANAVRTTDRRPATLPTLDLRSPAPTPRSSAGLPPVPGPVAGAPTRDPVGDGALHAYLQNMRELVAAQREVMLHYLGAPASPLAVAAPAPWDPAVVAAAPVSSTAAAPEPSSEVPSPEAPSNDAAPPGAGRPAVRGAALLDAVLRIVADRTGYPLDMLDPDLDLEADLSIDSIKRIEILGELADEVGLPGGGGDEIDESVIEELAQQKTLRSIVAWIDAHDGTDTAGPDTGGADAASVDAARADEARADEARVDEARVDEARADEARADEARADEARADDASGSSSGRGDADPSPRAVPGRPVRATLEPVALDPHGTTPVEQQVLAGTRFVVVDEGAGLGVAVAQRLVAAGARAELVDAATDPTTLEWDATDGLVHLAAMALDPPPRRLVPDGAGTDARQVFAWCRPAVLAGLRWIALASPEGPHAPAGLGLRGLAKTVARELPAGHVRCIGLDPDDGTTVLADHVVAELCTPPGPVEVSYGQGLRATRAVHLPTPTVERTDGERLGLTADSVVVVTGGGRGITARVAIALATTTGCRVELLGRTPLPDGPEDPDLADASDAPALRGVLARRPGATPATVEEACRRILAERELRATMTALAAAGTGARYHAVDVRDGEALAACLDHVLADHGRLDLVIHGAGVLDDRTIADKTADGFERVFATKVDAARTILDRVPTTTRVVLFGSISGVFGNRGQVDYSAANDALDDLAHRARRDGRHVLSVDWGPWAGTGMVHGALEREYERRGIGLIEPGDGIEALFAELARDARSVEATGPHQVVVLRADPAAFALVSPDPTASRGTRAEGAVLTGAIPTAAGTTAEVSGAERTIAASALDDVTIELRDGTATVARAHPETARSGDA